MPIDRLARRERDVPVPEPDSPEALVATLADWGAEHRPQEPCSTCGCTLYWTAAGDVMCAICLPMPRLTEGSRERIARLFPRTLRGAHESAGRPAVEPVVADSRGNGWLYTRFDRVGLRQRWQNAPQGQSSTLMARRWSMAR